MNDFSLLAAPRAWTSLFLLSLALPATASADQSSLQEVMVEAHPLSSEGLAQPVVVLEGDALARKRGTTLGQTLGKEPGIQSQSFGVAVGRPVIHGLTGPRVKVLEDRIDTLDASVSSTDHAATVDPFIADRIEVLKGANTLVYGAGAIGGVVDVHTGRIPHNKRSEAISGRGEASYTDNGDALAGALRLDGGIDLGESEEADQLVWHLDGFSSDAEAYDIPGFVESRQLRALEDEEEHESGLLEGSDYRDQGGALGLSWVGERGFFGFAVSQLSSRYGLPGAHEDEGGAEEEEGTPTLDLEQTRIDVEAGLENPFDGFESINFRGAINDYQHTEFEPDGEPGTEFDNDAYEVRVELVHEAVANWRGAVGLQAGRRDFAALGDEAFLSPTDTDSYGLFWVGERKLENVELEAGIRVDEVKHSPDGAFSDPGECGAEYASGLPDRDFTDVSASLGVIWPVSDNNRWSVQTDFASRAPVAEELYSCGEHLATQTFDIGNPDLDSEEAINVAVSFARQTDNTALDITAYVIEFSDYIYQAAGETPADELTRFAYTQEDAQFWGIDLSVQQALVDLSGGGRVTMNLLFDMVRGRLDSSVDGERDLPRIPAERYGIGFAVEHGVFYASLDYLYVAEQNRVAELELETDSYEDLGLTIEAQLVESDDNNQAPLTVFLRGNNLTDDEQRHHASFIKDFAPAPGRSITTGLRFSF